MGYAGLDVTFIRCIFVSPPSFMQHICHTQTLFHPILTAIHERVWAKRELWPNASLMNPSPTLDP